MNDDLDLRFRRAAERYAIPPGDVDRVVQQAHRRASRRRAASTALVAAVVAVAAVVQFGGDRRDGTPVAANGGARRGSSGIRWQRVDARTAIGQGLVSRGATPLYALSTAAGERESPALRRNRMVWRSGDGVEWSSVGALGDDLYLADLAPRDGRIYAVGTAPATAVDGRMVSDFLVGWSDDDGRSWGRTTLPIDLAGMVSKTKRVAVSQPQIAVGPTGSMAVTLIDVELDVPRLLPAGVTAPHGWVVTDTGVDLLGPRRPNACPPGMRAVVPETVPERASALTCEGNKGDVRAVAVKEAHSTIASYTFAELGVTGDLVSAVRRQPIVFVAEPGSTSFERAASPAVQWATTLALSAAGDGFDLAVTSQDWTAARDVSLLAFRSPDGRSWSEGSGVANGWMTAIGTLGGSTAALIGAEGTGAFVRSDGAGGWTSVSLASVLDPDVVAGRSVHVLSGDIGPLGVVAVVLVAPERGGDGTTRLLASRDGTTWDDHPLDELVGETGAAVTRVVVSERQAVVQLGLRPENERTPRRQVALVGSLD